MKRGDLVVQFDGSTLLRTVQEKQSELRQSDAEIEQIASPADKNEASAPASFARTNNKEAGEAARVKLRSSATAMKAARSASSSRRIDESPI